MYFVYILKLRNGQFYVGFTNNLLERVRKHKIGRINYTRKYLPVKLVFYAAFSSKSKAIRFEKYLKTSSGNAFRNKRLI